MLLDDHLTQPSFNGEDGKPAPFFRIDKKQWNRQLVWSERWESTLGCGGYVFVIGMGMFTAFFNGIWIFYLAFSLSIAFVWWKTRSIKKYILLKEHAHLSFVVHADRIVRYTATKYQVFLYKNIRRIRVRPYGVQLHTAMSWWQWLKADRYHYWSEFTLVVPKATENYAAIEAYLEQIEQQLTE